MWLTNSSVGRKVVMSVTGLALILFLTFHCAMNVVALISHEGYNWICEMLGSQHFADPIVSFMRDQGNNVHRTVKCQKQDKGETSYAHHHFPSYR